jgi:hypothetical protein
MPELDPNELLAELMRVLPLEWAPVVTQIVARWSLPAMPDAANDDDDVDGHADNAHLPRRLQVMDHPGVPREVSKSVQKLFCPPKLVSLRLSCKILKSNMIFWPARLVCHYDHQHKKGS